MRSHVCCHVCYYVCVAADSQSAMPVIQGMFVECILDARSILEC